jgi:D-cysteine desulfhydrase
MAQSFEMGLRLDQMICASGSGGTHAGLVTGLEGVNAAIPVTGISVRATKAAQEAKLHTLANETAELLGLRGTIRQDAFAVLDDYVGAGYSLPTDSMTEAVKLFARLEGILLDPVYTGKAAAGLIDLVRQGRFRTDENILFVHTGGSPALYAYQSILLD